MSKYLLIAIATSVSILSSAHAQACANGAASEINGNWYCQPVNAISYLNMGTPGSYNKITSMDGGQCGSTPQSYSGSIAPLDEEVQTSQNKPLSVIAYVFTDFVALSWTSLAEAICILHARLQYT